MVDSPGLLAPFLHTASGQKLDPGKAWERGYTVTPCVEMKIMFTTHTSSTRMAKTTMMLSTIIITILVKVSKKNTAIVPVLMGTALTMEVVKMHNVSCTPFGAVDPHHI